MDNFSEIEKALPAREVNGSPGRRAGIPARSESVDKVDEVDPLDDNPVHAGWVTGGRGIKKVINEDRLARFSASSNGTGAIDEADLLNTAEPDASSASQRSGSPGARDPHPDPRLAPGVPIQSGLGRAGSSAGHTRARERGQANPPSLTGRELEGGLVRGREGGSNAPTAPPLVSDGRWVKVTKVDDLWKVNDEWWRGAGEEIARLYYMIRLENSQQLTVYLDLITNNWYRQAG